MKLIRSCFSILLALLLVTVITVPAFADLLESDRLGSLKVSIIESKSKKGVPGGMIEIYQLCDVKPYYSGHVYKLTEPFSGSEFDVETIGELTAAENKAQAQKLAKFAADNSVASVGSAEPDKDGVALFSDLPLGVYLVVQTKTATRYDAIDPFLITIPQTDGENYVYDVDAAPKTGTVPAPSPTPTPTTPPSTPGKLPQTGQDWVRVYALGIIGAAVFTCGVIRRRRAYNE